MAIIVDMDRLCGDYQNGAQEEDKKICQLVLEVFTYDTMVEMRKRYDLKKLSEQQVRDQFALAIIDGPMKPLTDYLTSRGFHYQLNVQEGKIFIPNAPRSLARDVFNVGVEGLVREVSTLQPGQKFREILDFDGVKLY